jgi:conserved hypothetical protein
MEPASTRTLQVRTLFPWKKFGKILLALAVTVALLYWCFHQVEWAVFFATLRQARWVYLLPAFFVPFSVLALNALQWKIFLPRFDQIRFGRMFELISVFSMTVNVVPFWGGNLLMIYLLGEREKVGKTVALSAMTLDQIVEGPAKLFVFGIVFFFVPFPPWMREGMQGFLLLFAVAYLFLMGFAFRYRNREGKISTSETGWSGKAQNFVANWAHHLHVLRSWKALSVTVFLAILTKLLEVGAVYLLQRSLGIPLGWPAAFLGVAGMSLATTLPLTPGRVGLVEASLMLAYQFLGISASQALALAILIHAAHTLPLVAAGYFFGLKMGLRFEKEKMRTSLAHGAT